MYIYPYILWIYIYICMNVYISIHLMDIYIYIYKYICMNEYISIHLTASINIQAVRKKHTSLLRGLNTMNP
jgi:hypothetical protein